MIDTNDQVVAQVGRGVGEGNLGLPRGVTLDDKGASTSPTRPARASSSTAPTCRARRPSPTSAFLVERASATATFLYPNGVTVDGRGRVYVTDAGNDRVQVWSY